MQTDGQIGMDFWCVLFHYGLLGSLFFYLLSFDSLTLLILCSVYAVLLCVLLRFERDGGEEGSF